MVVNMASLPSTLTLLGLSGAATRVFGCDATAGVCAGPCVAPAAGPAGGACARAKPVHNIAALIKHKTARIISFRRFINCIDLFIRKSHILN